MPICNCKKLRHTDDYDMTQNHDISFSVRDLLLSQSKKYPTVQIYISSASI